MRAPDRTRTRSVDELRAWRAHLRRRRDPPWWVWLAPAATLAALWALGRWAGAW